MNVEKCTQYLHKTLKFGMKMCEEYDEKTYLSISELSGISAHSLIDHSEQYLNYLTWFLSSWIILTKNNEGNIDRKSFLNLVWKSDKQDCVEPFLDYYVFKFYDTDSGLFEGRLSHKNSLVITFTTLYMLKFFFSELGEINEFVKKIKTTILTKLVHNTKFFSDFGCIYFISDNQFYDLRNIYTSLSLLNFEYVSDSSSQYLKKTVDLSTNLVENLIHGVLASYDREANAFGASPGAEPHSGYSFCGMGSLTILEAIWIRQIDCIEDSQSISDRLNDLYSKFGYNRENIYKGMKKWVLSRYIENEGFNGRPGKALDICYDFWNLGIYFFVTQPKIFNSCFFNTDDQFLRSIAEPCIKSILKISEICGGGLAKSWKLEKENINMIFFNAETSLKPDIYHTNFGLIAIEILKLYLPQNSDVLPDQQKKNIVPINIFFGAPCI